MMVMDYPQTFQPVFDELELKVLETFREGPRFYIVGGEYQGERVVFKADVEGPSGESTRARLKLRREAAFLESVKLESIPRFFAKGTYQGYFWLIEEWVPGESQEWGESTFLFKPTFFTPQNLDLSLGFLGALQGLFPTDGGLFKRYTLADYEAVVVSDKDKIIGKNLARKVKDFVAARHKLFDGNQTVVTHHELYSPHIFVEGRELNVIDWENVGWGNPAYDFTELWMRSFTHPDFQKELWARFRHSQDDQETFDQLFSLETVLQGLGNLKLFKFPRVPEETAVAQKAGRFFLESLERVLVP